MPQNPYAAFQQPASAPASAPAAGQDPYAAFQGPASAPVTAPAPPATTAMQRLFGPHFLSDAADVVGTHLKNLVSGPYHALTDPPQNAQEAQEKGTNANSGAVANALGQFGLAAARTFVNPTVSAVKAIPTSRNATDVMNHVSDAVPIAGPLARSVENDAQTHGVVPALLGLGTDIAVPAAAGGAATMALRGTGLGTALASATEDSRNLYGSRVLMKGTPGELLQSALKPGVKYGARVGDSLQEALPHVIAQNPNLNGVSGFASAADAARDSAFQPYNNLIAPYRNPVAADPITGETLPGIAAGPVRPSSISGKPIVDAQMQSIPFMDKIDRPAQYNPGNPGRTRVVNVPAGEGTQMRMGMQSGAKPESWDGGIVNDTQDLANNYRRSFSVPEVDALRGDANAKLAYFYNKAGGDQAAALSNPETARIKAVGDSARSILYPQLESDAGLAPGSVADMQHNYGLLTDTADIANKREPVFARHDPVTLPQKIVSGHGSPVAMVWNYAVQNALGKLTDSDAQVNSAIDRYQNPGGTPLIARPGPLPGIAMPIGQALRRVPQFPVIANPFFLGSGTNNAK